MGDAIDFAAIGLAVFNFSETGTFVSAREKCPVSALKVSRVDYSESEQSEQGEALIIALPILGLTLLVIEIFIQHAAKNKIETKQSYPRFEGIIGYLDFSSRLQSKKFLLIWNAAPTSFNRTSSSGDPLKSSSKKPVSVPARNKASDSATSLARILAKEIRGILAIGTLLGNGGLLAKCSAVGILNLLYVFNPKGRER